MTKRIVLLQALSNMAHDLAKSTEGLGELEGSRPSPTEWSAVDILHHLIDIECRYRPRLQRVIDHDCPQLPALAPEDTGHTAVGSVSHLVKLFAREREQTINLLKGLTPDMWLRPAKHQTYGKLDLLHLVQLLASHDAEHLMQLSRLGQLLAEAGSPKSTPDA